MNIAKVGQSLSQKLMQKVQQPLVSSVNKLVNPIGASSLKGLDALGNINTTLVKKINPMGTDTFNRLYSLRDEVVTPFEKDNISSIFIGNRFGESSNEIINNYLRTGKLPENHQYWNKDTILKRVEEIRNLSKKFELDDNYLVKRGVKNLDFLPNKGEIFTEKGFMSTTASDKVAQKYSGFGAMVDIILPKGTNCNMNAQDCEILLNNGAQFKVLEKGNIHAKIQLLNPKV